jgi:hypothetical protein
MDSLIPFVVVIFVVISIVKKFAEQKQIEETKKQRQAKKVSMKDLPEETRRMIYGEGAPPVAKPRGAAPRQAQPRPVPARPAPPQRPAPQRRPDPVGAGPVPDMRAPRALAEKRERRSASPVAREAQLRPQQQRVPQQARRRPPQRPPRVAREAQEPARQAPPVRRKRPETERPAAPETPTQRRPAAPAAVMARRIFANPQSVRHAIIAIEVLGPPKGLQF